MCSQGCVVAAAETDSEQKKANDYSREALAKTNEILDLNPEFYTVWNYRRNILTCGFFPES